jgi:hypothetical protein
MTRISNNNIQFNIILFLILNIATLYLPKTSLILQKENPIQILSDRGIKVPCVSNVLLPYGALTAITVQKPMLYTTVTNYAT